MDGIAKKYPLIFTLFFALSATNTHAETLSHVLLEVSQTNPKILKSRLEIDEKEAVRKQAVADFIPDVTAVGAYTKSTLDQTNKDKTSHNRQIGIEARQSLFNGGKLVYALKASKEGKSAKRAAHENVKQNIYLQTIKAYTSLITSKDVVTLQKQQVDLLTEQLHATQVEFKQGEATQTDIKQAEARLSASRAHLVEAKGHLFAAESALTSLVGKKINAPQWTETVDPKNLPKTLEDAQQKAYQQHPSMQSAQNNINYHKALKKQVRSAYLPKIDAVASHTTRDTDDIKGYRDNRLGLEMSWQLFTGGRTHYTFKEAAIRESAAKEAYQQTRREILENVTSSFHAYETAKALFRARVDEKEATQRATNGVEKEHALGERSVLDLLDARQELLETKVNFVKAKAGLITSAYTLLAATGELNTFLFKE